ncbi:uncharacterized protein LOC117064129 [Trachypithecus francoisi]|uniref:uncharacterized protein LOC117064129 n=1 Tax=Trachypithecus francoisi TaxID=54180 RepID=UPI00141AB885|nr:uncharacterized protein LOC117064129 [Trachypithecus francoisi]
MLELLVWRCPLEPRNQGTGGSLALSVRLAWLPPAARRYLHSFQERLRLPRILITCLQEFRGQGAHGGLERGGRVSRRRRRAEHKLLCFCSASVSATLLVRSREPGQN